jgi:transcriptional regulator with XRE-family HTH domain
MGKAVMEAEWCKMFGEKLSWMLLDAQISQRQLALEIGVTEASISKYIHGTQIPGVKSLINIAKVLDCYVDDLINFDTMIY